MYNTTMTSYQIGGMTCTIIVLLCRYKVLLAPLGVLAVMELLFPCPATVDALTYIMKISDYNNCGRHSTITLFLDVSLKFDKA